MRSWCPGYICPLGPFDMPFVREDHELGYLRNLRQLTARVGEFRRMSDIDLIFFKRLYDRLYLVYDAPDWWQELNFEVRHKRGLQHLPFL